MRGFIGKSYRTLALGLVAWAPVVSADWELNMPRGVTPISKSAYDLHMLILWICVAIGVVVFGAMFWSLFQHRKSKGAAPAQFHESTTLEVVWTIIPFFILVGMAIPATKTLIAIEDASESEMTVKVTGYQWRWRYDYLGEDFGFFSTLSPESNAARQLGSGADVFSVENYLLDVDKPLVLPTDTKVRILSTAADVLHAWWVPDFGYKRDAIPGFINEMWAKIDTPGTYRGQCAELCGKDHGFMPIVVEAKSEADYQAWLGNQKMAGAAAAAAATRSWTHDELMEQGATAYGTSCAACHQANGQGIPGAFPALKGSAIATGPLDAHLDIVLHGKPGTAMAAFANQLGDADLAAIITYERNAWGNDTGDTVQPSAIKAAR